jgi:hypothetical protein
MACAATPSTKVGEKGSGFLGSGKPYLSITLTGVVPKASLRENPVRVDFLTLGVHPIVRRFMATVAEKYSKKIEVCFNFV